MSHGGSMEAQIWQKCIKQRKNVKIKNKKVTILHLFPFVLCVFKKKKLPKFN